MKHHLAGFWPRLAAFGLDYLIIIAYILIVLALGTRLLSMAAGPSLPLGVIFESPARMDLFAFLSLVLPVTLYFTLCECSSSQATWGKRRMHLRVTTVDGRRLSLPRSLARSGLKFLPWQIAHTSLFHIPGWPLAVQQVPLAAVIGFGIVWLLAGSYLILLAFSRSHRTLYDRAAGTMVERGSH